MPNSRRVTGRTWSLILAITGFARAISYEFRPPRPDGSLKLIEGALPYMWWAAILLAASTVLTVGVLARFDWLTFAGHCVLLGCYATFACSVAASAVFYGQPWSGLMPLVIVSILHAERILTVGRTIGGR